MNRRGDLLNNTLGLIIVLLGLILIFFAAVKLYQFVINQDSEKAKNVLTRLEQKIESLERCDGNECLETTVTLQGPKKWYLLAWSVGDAVKPERCLLKSCVCMCKAASKESCDESGVCRALSVERVKVTSQDMINNKPVEGTSVFFTSSLVDVKLVRKGNSVDIISAKGQSEYYNEPTIPVGG